MKSFFTTLAAMLIFGMVFSQSEEHYLQITINEKSDLYELTTMVSIDGVEGNTIMAYANDNELAGLKKSSFLFVELEHPSTQSEKAIIMATTVEQMANWDRYPTYEVYVQMMQNWAANYPEICKLDTIGYSERNRMLLALKISDNVTVDEAEPQVLYTSTMHGDETTGMIFMMRLIDYLLVNYGVIDRATNMVNNIALHISPNTNPDGTYYSGNGTVSGSRRSNYNGVDLNRDYPDPRMGMNTPYAAETQAMMSYASAHHFILGANFHGGIELVNYPWDTWYSAQNTHADNDWFATISRQYASLAQSNSPAGYMTAQNNGITHGADWYPAVGGRQDYMNYWHHCKEVTIEVSNTKLLSTDLLPAYWGYNQESILTFIENVYSGVRGLITNSAGEPLNATVTIVDHDKDNSHAITNPANGDYYRMLLPGTYNFKFEAYGYIPQTIAATVIADQATTLDVVLQQANVVSVGGLVINAQNGLPLDEVSITLLGTPLDPVLTNAQGEFFIADIMEGDYDVFFVKDGFFSKTISITVASSMDPLCVVMDLFNGFSFEDGEIPEGFVFSGNQNWSVVSGEAYDGTKSLKSGAITHNQSTVMTYTFEASSAGQIVFYAKVSTEANYDKFKFYIDNSLKGTWSGQIDWTEYAFDLTEGEHTLKWEYSRDVSVGGGSDAVWVDFIAVPQTSNENAIPFVSPRNVDFPTADGQGTVNVLIKNIGQGTLNYTATIENASQISWLGLANTTGALTNNQSSQIELNYNFNIDDIGAYVANVEIDVADSVITIPVTIDYLGGIFGADLKDLTIYPNPAKSTVTIQLPGGVSHARMAVYSVSGHKLSEQDLNSDMLTFTLNTLGITNQGVYFIRVETVSDVFQSKLVVQNEQ
ncbi:MAG: M14 family zinc carboxypeptidase [Salinivirgaceae bacterium]|nr:M14 family zinc carboxypeptidase [Salinivirgaceae bacterium]